MELIEREGMLIVTGTDTYVDGSEYYGPEQFEAEHGITFAEFCERQEAEDITPEKEGQLYRED